MTTPQKIGSNMSYQLSPKSNQLNGYMSQGQVSDANSARLSNVQTFKYNPVNMIRKVSPQAGTMEYSSGGEQRMLPNI